MIKNITLGSVNAIKAYIGTSLVWDRDAAIKALFADGKQGVWYDPSDLSTMFKDAAGTQPVTADGEPVGLILDKSKGLEKVSVSFTRDANEGAWIDIGNGTYTSNKTVSSSGILAFNIDNYGTGSRTFEITYKVSRYVSGFVKVWQPTDSPYAASVGEYTRIVHSSHSRIRFLSAEFDGDISDIRIKELKGNHATQTVSAARPAYRTDGILHWLEPDGVDDSLLFNGAYLANSEYHLSAAITMFESRVMYIIGGLIGGNNGNLHAGFSPFTGVFLAQWANDLVYPAPVNPFIDGCVISGSLDSVGKSIYINNALKANDAVNTKLSNLNTTYALFRIESRNYLNGKFFGIVLINKSLDVPTAKQVVDYLTSKSGVTL